MSNKNRTKSMKDKLTSSNSYNSLVGTTVIYSPLVLTRQLNYYGGFGI
jgi:hypothetical protein